MFSLPRAVTELTDSEPDPDPEQLSKDVPGIGEKAMLHIMTFHSIAHHAYPHHAMSTQICNRMVIARLVVDLAASQKCG